MWGGRGGEDACCYAIVACFLHLPSSPARIALMHCCVSVCLNASHVVCRNFLSTPHICCCCFVLFLFFWYSNILLLFYLYVSIPNLDNPGFVCFTDIFFSPRVLPFPSSSFWLLRDGCCHVLRERLEGRGGGLCAPRRHICIMRKCVCLFLYVFVWL